jgi:hypothetical protein
MARGKKGYRARHYSRGARIAPRGRMSARTPWMIYLVVGVFLVVAAVWTVIAKMRK